MEFIYNVPNELKHYDEVFKSWNEMVEKNIDEETNTVVREVVKWWDNYPDKEEKKQRIGCDKAPRKVWDIFDRFKITRTEKAYGIYYTLEYILGDKMELEITSIQFRDNGEVNIGVIIEDLVICDNICHSLNTCNIVVLDVMNSTSKA